LHEIGFIRIEGGIISEKPSILTINCGSSTIKLPFYEVVNPLNRRISGKAVRLAHLAKPLFGRVTPHGEALPTGAG
jgi:hypothetical protein